MRKTKIICTLGPASDNEDTIREMMLAGMDVARINLSHGDYAEHRKKIMIIKKLRSELGLHTALLLDTKGPEIRLGTFEGGRASLKPNTTFTLRKGTGIGDESGASVSAPSVLADIHIGAKVLIDDGLIELKAESYDGENIGCRVINGGVVSDRKSINLPGTQLSLPFISAEDRSDLAFGVAEDFDFVAASFAQTADNIIEVRRELEKHGDPNIRVIAKIENAAGVENIDSIISESDGIMVARGDMGVEIPMEDIPVIQKKLISKCYNAGKQVITATQMLDSMTKQPRPTRAEITDVANAIYDGTSAIMLSGETAAGLYPVEAVKTMARIAKRTESDIDYKKRFSQIEVSSFPSVTNAISHATCTTALDLKASAIITVTKSGQTARLISRYRPETQIIGCTPDEKTCRHMNMSWGVTPVLIDEMTNTDDLLANAVQMTYEQGHVNNGDLVVITTGLPLGIPGTTNMLKVQIVGNVLTSGTGIGDSSVCGTLCVCRDEDEAIRNFKAGNILVIQSASHRIINVLRNSRGIVCEKDGIESYAAIVGQALNIPVIVGAIGATKILKSGTVVTVDSAKGIVYTGSDDCILGNLQLSNEADE